MNGITSRYLHQAEKKQKFDRTSEATQSYKTNFMSMLKMKNNIDATTKVPPKPLWTMVSSIMFWLGLATMLTATTQTVSAQQQQLQIQTVRYGYFAEARPIHAACARGFFDLRLPSRNLMYEVTCYPQTSGGFVASRLDNEQLQIANLGSTPLAEAIARGIDIKTIYLSHYMGESQGIYVRPSNSDKGYQGISTPFDLVNRTLGVPFGSTMHYQVLFLVDLFGLAGSVHLRDLSPSEIIQAWDENTIDAAACWGLARNHLLEHGASPAETLLTSQDIANWGKPTFVAVAVLRKFANQHPEFVTHFVGILSRLNDSFLDRQGQDDPKNILRWNIQQQSASAPSILGTSSFLPSLVDALMLGEETPQNPNQDTLHRERNQLELFHQLPAAVQMSCEYLGPGPGQCDRHISLLKETLQDTAQFLLQQKVIASLGPLGDLESLDDEIDGSYLTMSQRDCANSYCPVGPYPSLAGTNDLLSELEQLDAESGKSPFAETEVGRRAKGDSTCGPLRTIAGSASQESIQGAIGDGADAQPGKSYSDNLKCAWSIHSPDDNDIVELSFLAVRLWSGDQVLVYSDPIHNECQPDRSTNVLEAQLSGYHKSGTLPPFRARACLLVVFETDSNSEKWYGHDGGGDGFVAEYNRRAPRCSSSSDCNGHGCNRPTGLCECGGSAFGGDCSFNDFCLGTNRLVLEPSDKIEVKSSSSVDFNNAFYPNNLDCRWDIQNPSGFPIKVTVSYGLETTHDLLYLQTGALSFDGATAPSTYAVLTGSQTDTAQVLYIPSSSSASMHLTTDARGRRDGFHATLETIDYNEMPLDPVVHQLPCPLPGTSGSYCEVDHCIANNRFQEPAETDLLSDSHILGRVVSQIEGAHVQDTSFYPFGCTWSFPIDVSLQDIVAVRFVFNRPFDLEPKFSSESRNGDELVVRSGSEETKFYVQECQSKNDCLKMWQTGSCEKGRCVVNTAIEAKALPGTGLSIGLLTDRNDGGNEYQGIDFDAMLVQQCPNKAGLEHCEHPDSGGKCEHGHCMCSGGIPCDCPCIGNAPSTLAAKVGLTVGIVLPLFLVFIGGFLLYRRRKILASREQKRIIAEKDAELAAFRDTIVGICVAVREYVPQATSTGALKKGGGKGARAASLRVSHGKGEPPKVVWCWQETSHVMDRHAPSAVFGDPKDCWIIYDSKSTALLESSYQAGKATCDLEKIYEVDLSKMIQTKLTTRFQRKIQRVVSGKPDTTKDLDLSEAHFSDGLPSELQGEPQIVLIKDDLVQVSKRRDDGWCFGSKMYHADEEAARELVKLASKDSPDDANILTDTGWFQEEATSVPTKDQLSALQTKVGDANVLDAPNNWTQVNDPTVVERIPMSLNSGEGAAVVNAFLSTLTPSRFRNLKVDSVFRIQNLAMWQSFVVKRQTICYRDTEGKDNNDQASRQRAQQRVERCWLWHGTNADVMEKIMQQGFNRSFCGKNATMYGKGVYFARDASYSAHRIYAVPDHQGYQYIMACRVVVGEYCRGVKDALTPKIRDASTNMLYDSTVDDEFNPSIYVTYHDAQAYPEYLIRFRYDH